MLFSAVTGPLANGSSRPLYGGALGYSYGNGLADAAGVTQLQQALIAYAQNTQDQSANPGPADGVLNTWTILATINVVWKAADKVDGLKQLKNDLIGNIPGINTIINKLLGNPTVTLVAWGIAQTAYPKVTNAITAFIDSKANLLAGAVNIAAGLVAAPPPPVGPAGATTSVFQRMTVAPGALAIITNAQVLPKGSIQTFDPKFLKYRVAIPKGLGGYLGEVTHVERADLATTTPRTDAVIVSNGDFADKAGVPDLEPWYKTTLGMIGIGVGVLAVGVGGYYLVK